MLITHSTFYWTLTLSACYFLLNHCFKSVKIRFFFWSVLSRIRTRKDSVFGHFSRSECYRSNQGEVEEEAFLIKASFLMALKETRKNIVIGRISLNTTHSKHVAVEEKQRELARKTQTQIQTQT